MMRSWIDEVLEKMDGGAVVRAVVVDARGSCPRDTGAAMLVGAGGSSGTIGGGALEHAITEQARFVIEENAGLAWFRHETRFQLGPELNQCCGGAMSVLLERYGESERSTLQVLAQIGTGVVVQRPLTTGTPLAIANCGSVTGLSRETFGVAIFAEPLAMPRQSLVIYGAGHVARAVVRALEGLPFEITWADEEAGRFPVAAPIGVTMLATSDIDRAVNAARMDALHLVMTRSHALDEAIVAAILRRGAFGYLGLIGSATKKARFRQRLAKAGFTDADIGRMICPIGLAELRGKSPAEIAIGVAADLLRRFGSQPSNSD